MIRALEAEKEGTMGEMAKVETDEPNAEERLREQEGKTKTTPEILDEPDKVASGGRGDGAGTEGYPEVAPKPKAKVSRPA